MTADHKSETGTESGLSDHGGSVWKEAITQRIKATLGITGLSPQVHIDGEVWHLDVGSSHPGARESVPKKFGLFAH